jgi:hypothetical protein
MRLGRSGRARVGTFGAMLAVLAIGCGGSKSSGEAPDAGVSGDASDTCGNPSSACVVQPPPPDSGTATRASHNYAIRTLYISTDRQGNPSADAWKSYGYNLDGLVTTQTSTDVCTLSAGAPSAAQLDGNGGIDNSFGANIWTIVEDVAGAQAQEMINASIGAGQFTVMMDVTGFDDTPGNTTSALGLTGVLLAGGNYADLNGGAAPSWNTSTHWPILPSLLQGCTAATGCPAGTDPVASAQITFPAAYQASGTFVNGTPTTLSLSLSLGGSALAIDIDSALITFAPAAGGVTNGTIAGTIRASDLITQFEGVAGSLSTTLCGGTAFAAVSLAINQASDIVIDAAGNVSNAAGSDCNGISVGIGFDATEIATPVSADIEGPQPATPDPCAGN